MKNFASIINIIKTLNKINPELVELISTDIDLSEESNRLVDYDNRQNEAQDKIYIMMLSDLSDIELIKAVDMNQLFNPKNYRIDIGKFFANAIFYHKYKFADYLFSCIIDKYDQSNYANLESATYHSDDTREQNMGRICSCLSVLKNPSHSEYHFMSYKNSEDFEIFLRHLKSWGDKSISRLNVYKGYDKVFKNSSAFLSDFNDKGIISENFIKYSTKLNKYSYTLFDKILINHLRLAIDNDCVDFVTASFKIFPELSSHLFKAAVPFGVTLDTKTNLISEAVKTSSYDILQLLKNKNISFDKETTYKKLDKKNNYELIQSNFDCNELAKNYIESLKYAHSTSHGISYSPKEVQLLFESMLDTRAKNSYKVYEYFSKLYKFEEKELFNNAFFDFISSDKIKVGALRIIEMYCDNFFNFKTGNKNIKLNLDEVKCYSYFVNQFDCKNHSKNKNDIEELEKKQKYLENFDVGLIDKNKVKKILDIYLINKENLAIFEQSLLNKFLKVKSAKQNIAKLKI